jgi:CDP-diacylglycerol--glycerol-3-phosphate 3-phosphatidyltransferase
MSITRAIGGVFGYVLRWIVHALTITRVHPNVLTSIGLAINAVAALMFARGDFLTAGIIVLCGAVFDLVDGPVARQTKQVTRFGGFLDSVLDRYSDLILLMGLLVYYASINRFFYIILTAIVMTGSVMVSYTRARSENAIAQCKVGFLERPERIVLIIIGALTNRMAPVLWVMAVLSNVTVVHRIVHTWHEAQKFEGGGEPALNAEQERGAVAAGQPEPSEKAAAHSLREGYRSA